jgi:hypothetical protein
MKRWPAFDDNGDLPPGVHQATIGDVLRHFGTGSVQRHIVGRRLARVYNLALGTGQLARFVVFGSFVTAKPEPNDIDVFMLMEDTFEVGRVRGEAAVIFNHTAAQGAEGASVFWIRRAAAIGGEDAAIADWQVKRDGGERGIVEVIRDDQE